MDNQIIFSGFKTLVGGHHVACLTRGLTEQLGIPIILEIGQEISEELILEQIKAGIAKIDASIADVRDFTEKYQGRILKLDD